MRILMALSVLLLTYGCATVSPSIPEGYSGPRATLQDSGATEGGTKGRVFAALELDGQGINNSLRETRIASQNRGFALSFRLTDREVPAKKLKVKLIGTHILAAPIHELASRVAGTFFSVDGEVELTAEAGETYIVTGELSKEKSCVWVMRRSSQSPASEKVCTK